jgi:hypothetical protein
VHTADNGWMVATDAHRVTAFSPSGKVVRAIPKASDATAFSLGSSGKRLALADTSGISTFDLESGQQLARLTPCGNGPVDDVEWSEEETRLLVTCGPGTGPARVLVLGADGTEEREPMQGPRSRYFVRPRGDRVAVTHPDVGVVVFDIASGRELFRVAPPQRTGRYLELTRDLERFLFRPSSTITSFVVLDQSGNAVNASLHTEGPDLEIDRAGGLLQLRSRGVITDFDPATDEILHEVPGPLNREGTVFLSLVNRLDLVDRRTGQRRTLPSEHAVGVPPEFSEGGGWLGVVEDVPRGRRVDRVYHLYDTRTGKEGPIFPFGSAIAPVAWSPDDAILAIRSNTGKPNCADSVAPECSVVLVYEARSGRQVATIRPAAGMHRMLFLPDGKRIVVNARVHDARTGRLAWTFPPDAGIEMPLPLPGSGIVVSVESRWQLLDAASGKVVREIPYLGAVKGTSPSGRAIVSMYDGTVWIWDTSTWTKRDTKLHLDSDARVYPTDDGRFVYLADGADLVVYRVEDGRSLRRKVPAFDFDVTDEGVFDPAQAQSGALLVRRGADVAKSPMGTLEFVAEELGHPNLVADFMAGKPVGRR